MDVRQHDFRNGARLVFNPMPDMASVSVGVWVKTGSRYEHSGISGISHFLEHLLFKGTKTRTALQISQEIEGIGGAINAFTSEEYTCYYVKVLKHHVLKAMDILFDMVLNPLLRPADIVKEKGVIKEELNMYLDIPSHYVEDLLSEIMWKGHPLGRRILGSIETLDGITRKKLADYMGRCYSAANIVVAVAGRSSLESLKAMAAPYIEKLPLSARTAFEPYAEGQAAPSVRLEKKKTEQTHIAIGFKACSRVDPERYKAKLLSIILGGNMSSRLFQEVREKHSLSYAIHSQLNQFIDTGAFEIAAGVKNGAVCKAVELVVREIRKIRKRAVEKRELSMAKEYIIGQIMLSLENTKNNMIQLGENLLTAGRVIPIREMLHGIRGVQRDDVLEMADRIFRPGKANLAMVGNVPEKSFIEDALRSI